MITIEIKKRTVEALKTHLANFSSGAKMAISVGISGSQLSRILKGELEGVLSDSNWISIARKLDVQLKDSEPHITAKTPMFVYIYAQLQVCKNESISGLLCDLSDTGKTYAAKVFAKENKNAIYIDCSLNKSKQKLIREISKELGLGSAAKYSDVCADLVFYLRSIPNPIVILDEAGDLDYAAFLELKALWNATEGCCAWYMMGADGLREKMELHRGRKKVGYAEIFTRFGSTYQRVTPMGKEALEDFKRIQVSMIAKANNPNVNIKEIIAKTNGSLRRVRIELRKLKVSE